MIKRTVAIAIGGVAALTLVAGPAGAQEPASEAQGCKYGTWPAGAEGQPANFHAGSEGGVYIWHTSDGWRLRVTHPGHDRVEFKGTITTGGRIHQVERRTESNDVAVNKSRHKVAYRFANYGYVDGLDFHMSCTRGFAVNATVNGQRLPADHVFIGADGHHPSQVPFTVRRQK